MRLLFVFSLLLLTAGSARAADTVLTTVDDVTVDWSLGSATFTGIVAGEATARTVSFMLYGSDPTNTIISAALDLCQRSALLSLNRPGRYVLTIQTADPYFGATTLGGCKLKRNQ